MPELPVSRTAISTDLIRRVEGDAMRLESSVFLAPLFGGKRYVLDHVSGRLAEREVRVVRFKASDGGILTSEAQVVRSFLPALDPAVVTLSGFFGELEKECDRTGLSSVVVLPRLDVLSRELAKRFLEHVRTASYARRRVTCALIGAESALADLIVGSKSEFNCGTHYMLQGFDRQLFDERFHSYVRDLAISFPAGANGGATLFDQCNGSTFLMRQILITFVEQRLSRQEGHPDQLDAQAIDRILDRLATPGPRECLILRHTADVLGTDLALIVKLHRILQGDDAADSGAPGRLELSGALYSDPHRLGRLYPSSPIMESFLRREFSSFRLGSIFALHGQWEEAEAHYRLVASPHQTLSAHDHLLLKDVLRRLHDVFEREDIDRLRQIFRDSLPLLFGIDTDAALTSLQWDGHEWTSSRPLPKEVYDAVRDARAEKANEFVFRSYLGVIVDPATALVLEEPGDVPTWIRRELCSLLVSYARALHQQQERAKETGRRELRVALQEVLVALLKAADPERLSSPAEIRAQAEEALRRLPIVESVRCSLARDSAPPASGDEASRGIGRALPDEKEPSPTWLFPLRNANAALGVLAVTLRTAVASDDVMLREFQHFAAELSGALAYAEFTTRIHDALARIDEPVILVDAPREDAQQFEVVYANKPALVLFRVADRPNLAARLRAGFRAGIATALRGQRKVEFPSSIDGAPYEGTVVYEPLPIGGEASSALIHIQGKSHYVHILEAFRRLARAEDEEMALTELAAVLRDLGHSWMRVYKIVDGQDLVPFRCIDPERPEVVAGFPGVHLPPRSDEAVTWRAIVEQRPRVCAFLDDDTEGKTVYTEFGLPVLIQRQAHAADILGKALGDHWIDFPLPDGKFTIPCGRDLRPERFQMFEMLTPLVLEQMREIARGRLAPGRMQELYEEFCHRAGPLEAYGALLEKLIGTEELAAQTPATLLTELRFVMERLRAPLERAGGGVR